MACPNGCGEKVAKKDVSTVGVVLLLFIVINQDAAWQNYHLAVSA